jgi:UPF0271 protein
MLLNLDAGEHDDEPDELYALADILAVACGGHAGDANSMSRVAAFIARSPRPTALGAHPSYPDVANFGRQSIDIDPAALQSSVAEQCRALAAAAAAHGVTVLYVKPHGALYHDAAKNRLLANAIIDGALAGLRGSLDGTDSDLDTDAGLIGSAFDDGPAAAALAEATNPQPLITFIGPPTGAFADAVRIRGLTYLREGFADRAVRPDGSLVPRTEPGALITDPVAAAARARELVDQVDTICVHADSPGSLEIARAVRAILDRAR